MRALHPGPGASPGKISRERVLRRAAILGLAAGIAVLAPAALHAEGTGSAPTRADFELRTAGQLLALCTAGPNHELHVAARAFCYGFISGSQHYHDALAPVAGLGPVFCPDGQKTRDELVEVFVASMRAEPQRASDRPVDALFQAFAERWPCPKPTPAKDAR